MKSGDWFEKILNNFASKSLGKRVRGMIVVGIVVILISFLLLYWLLFSNQIIKVECTIDNSSEKLELILAHNPFEKISIPKRVLLTFDDQKRDPIEIENINFDPNRNVLIVAKPAVPLPNQYPCSIEFEINYKNMILSVIE